MRIAQVSTVGTPVGPDTGAIGSVEGLVFSLARELTALGHDLTVFGAPGSDAPGHVVETVPGVYGKNGAPGDWFVCEWMNMCAAVARADEFDVIHSHAYLWGLPLGDLCDTAMLHTLHVTASYEQQALRQAYGGARVVAPSHAQWSAYADLSPYAVVPHGVDPDRFTPTSEHRGYLCYLGRFTPDKGPLRAIDTAQAVGLPLLIAGPRNSYFDAVVAPRIDGASVQYVGVVQQRERDDLLGGAAALLYPVSRGEPFGLVLIEAMMCGTPVVATAIGAVPEVVEEGVTGALCDDATRLVEVVPTALALPRRAVRARAEQRFTARQMATRYVDVYRRLLAERAA